MIPLRTSQIAFYAAVVTLTVTLATGIGFWFIRAEMLAGNDFLLDAESEEILARVQPLKAPVTAVMLDTALKEHTQNDEAMFYFQVHSPDGGVIYNSPNMSTNRLPIKEDMNGKETVNVPVFGLIRVAEYHTPLLHVQIAMSLRNFESVNETFLRVFLLGIPLIACLSVGFGMILRHLTLRPLRLMQATARRITAQNLTERIPVPPSGGDMRDLATLLNAMMDRLEKSFNEVKRFTADTSHELMTPLSVVRLHAEKLLSDPELPPKYRQAIEEQLQETLHLTETLERLLTLAKADSSVLPLKLLPHATQDYIRQFAEDAQVLAESKGRKLAIVQNEPGTASFDAGWIRQVLFNLLSNAIRYNPPGGNITCYARHAENHWTVELWDEGPGVPPEKLKDIFERFVQLTPRSEPGSGAGLGLAICKSIVELHGGSISARLRPNGTGLIVAFQLPKS
jgi:signal transduction histidine kinase